MDEPVFTEDLEVFLDGIDTGYTPDEQGEVDFHENLASKLGGEATAIVEKALAGFDADKQSRSEWESMLLKGIEYLGLKVEESTEPFDGACQAVHPLLIENAVKFQSKVIQTIWPAGGPVKTQVVGKVTPEKEAKAQRVKDFENFQLCEQMSEYYDDMERMLFALPLIGSAFKKVYYDRVLERPVSEYIPIERFHIAAAESDLRRASRYSEILYLTPGDFRKKQLSGLYLDDVEMGEPGVPEKSSLQQAIDSAGGFGDRDEGTAGVYELIEQYTDLELSTDIDQLADGSPMPYILTIDLRSRQVVALRRNWDMQDPKHEKIVWHVHYKYVPCFWFYGLGLIHLVGNLTMSATLAMRALADAGQFATLPAGFKAKGVRIVNSDPLSPGEWREVEATGMDLTKALIPLPYREPSQTLLAMLQFMDERGQRFADTTEQVVADSTNYGPVGTTMALLEASTKFFSAINKRLHKGLRDEFKILTKINYMHLPEEYPYEVEGGERTIFAEDFDGSVGVIPVSDPNISSQAQRLANAQAQLAMAQQAPQLHNMREAFKRFYDAMGVQDIDKLLPEAAQAQQLDPVSEIAATVQGAPVKAFPGQDHDAHIAVLSAWVQDPLNGGNPVMQAASAAIVALVKEHMLLKWQEQMAGLVQGQGQGPMDRVVAEAAQQILAANMAAAQGGNDLDIEKANLELQAKSLELQEKRIEKDQVKDVVDASIRMKDLSLREAALKQKAGADNLKVAVGAKEKILEQETKMAIEGMKVMQKKVAESD